MNRQKIITLVCVSLMLVIVLVAAGCTFTDAPEVSASVPIAFDRQRADTANIARWQALGERYALKVRSASASEADLARWVAMGERYAPQLRSGSADQADLARWIAKGVHYSAEPELALPVTADVARWIAMGEHYAK